MLESGLMSLNSSEYVLESYIIGMMVISTCFIICVRQLRSSTKSLPNVELTGGALARPVERRVGLLQEKDND